MDVRKLIEYFRSTAKNGSLSVSHLADGILLATNGVVLVRSHRDAFLPLLRRFAPLDTRDGRVYWGKRFQPLDKPLIKLWEKEIQDELHDLTDTGIYVDDGPHDARAFLTRWGRYRYVDRACITPFLRQGYSFRSKQARYGPIVVSREDQPVALVMPLGLGEPVPMLNYLRTRDELQAAGVIRREGGSDEYGWTVQPVSSSPEEPEVAEPEHGAGLLQEAAR